MSRWVFRLWKEFAQPPQTATPTSVLKGYLPVSGPLKQRTILKGRSHVEGVQSPAVDSQSEFQYHLLHCVWFMWVCGMCA